MTVSATGAAGQQAAAAGGFPDAGAVVAAHRLVRADPRIQFDFPRFQPKQAKPPQWLIDTLRFIDRLVSGFGSGWTILFWVLIGLFALALAIAIFPPARQWVTGLWRRARQRGVQRETPRWAPATETARKLLEEADALAAQGQYDEAVHLILYRSIEDIESWRGDLVRPSLTSRDIAGADALPDRARGVFAGIVALVERSLFAGHGLGADDWHRARADYSGFALGGA